MDNTGNYVYSFYVTSGVILTGFLIPMVLIVIRIKRRLRISPVEFPQDEESVRKI